MQPTTTQPIIDTAQAKNLMRANSILGASIIGVPGGWSVLLKLSKVEKTLGTQRSNKPRRWISLDRCVKYVKQELGVARFNLLDATRHRSAPAGRAPRADAAERLRRTHAAAAHDQWFREQVREALNDPAPGVADDVVRRQFAAKRARLRKLANATVKAAD